MQSSLNRPWLLWCWEISIRAPHEDRDWPNSTSSSCDRSCRLSAVSKRPDDRGQDTNERTLPPARRLLTTFQQRIDPGTPRAGHRLGRSCSQPQPFGRRSNDPSGVGSVQSCKSNLPVARTLCLLAKPFHHCPWVPWEAGKLEREQTVI